MPRTTLLAGIVLLSFLAVTLVSGQQGKQPQGPLEQPGPFGFPGVKHLSESLKLTPEQAAALHRIYNEYQKKEHQAQQEAAKEAQKDKTPGSKPPRADTKGLRDDMVNEIKTILSEEQRKTFDEMLSEMGKKKKKNS
jgi:Spy/CpxP family protein refolding chaperone